MKYSYRGTTTWIEHPGGWCEYYDRRLTLDEIKQEWERMQPVRHRFTPGEQLFGRKVPLDKKPTQRCDPERLRALARMTAKERKEEFWEKEYEKLPLKSARIQEASHR